MDIVSFKFLDLENWRIVKLIRLEKQIARHYMWADLIYTRSVTAKYKKESEKEETPSGIFYGLKEKYPKDAFDEMVLKAVKQDYPDAFFRNAEIVTDMEAERFKNLYKNHHKESAVIHLQPDLSCMEYGNYPIDKQFSIFNVPFVLYIPCDEFVPYFANEGYFLNYNLSMEEELRLFIKEIKPTIHSLEEIIK